MDIKKILKERLLEIPFRSKAQREFYSLADYLKLDVKDIKPLLDELVKKNILLEKTQYICPTCHSTTIMDAETLSEVMDEEEVDCFLCDNCMNYIKPEKNKTGYIFYDVIDEESLNCW